MSPNPTGTAPSLSAQLSDLKAQINRTQRVWLMSVGVALVMLFIGMSVIQGPWQIKRQRFAKVVAEEEQRSQLLTQILGQKKRLGKLGENLLLIGGAPVLAREVARLATESGLAVESVVPRPETTFDHYKKLQIKVIAEAGYAEVVSFLRAAESFRPMLIVDRMEMGSPRQEALSGYSLVRQTQVKKYEPAKKHRVELLISAFSEEKVGR